MFVVNKDSTQYLSVEIATASYYIFRALISGSYVIFKPAVTVTTREKLFTIVESATEDLANGTVSFPYASEIYYEIYGSDSSDLTIPDSDPLFRGWLKVERTAQTNTSYINTQTRAVYDPRD